MYAVKTTLRIPVVFCTLTHSYLGAVLVLLAELDVRFLVRVSPAPCPCEGRTTKSKRTQRKSVQDSHLTELLQENSRGQVVAELIQHE